MGGDQLFVHHGAQVVVAKFLDLGHFVRGTETIEEMEERDARAQGRGLADAGHVVGFLDRAGSQQGEAGLAAGHDVGLVTENGETVGGHGAGRDVHAVGRHFAGDLVHVGDIEEQALGGGKRGSERAGLERAVNRTRGAAFGLHFDNGWNRAPDVLAPVGRPQIGHFSHAGRRRDGIDGDDLVGAVGHRGDGFGALEGGYIGFDCRLGLAGAFFECLFTRGWLGVSVFGGASFLCHLPPTFFFTSFW